MEYAKLTIIALLVGISALASAQSAMRSHSLNFSDSEGLTFVAVVSQ